MTKNTTEILPFAPVLLLSMPKACYHSFKRMDFFFYLLVLSKLDFNFIWKRLCLYAVLDLLALEAEMFALLQSSSIVWEPDKTNFLQSD